MRRGPVYVLDSDVLMTAARSYYAFDLVPAFWDAIVREARNGRLLSIDRVKHEIDEGKDKLKDWANNDFHTWFDSTSSPAIRDAYKRVMQWGWNQPQFTPAAKQEFADEKNADPWVVAYAMAKGCFVVTNERFDANIRRRIKIPNVCQAFNVQYVDLFEMLRRLGLRLS
ncbi:MAG: twitching motility protein PilT [Gemmatimonadales bacterium]|nr:MAG: twitching motility protein PilT [Gemmatimonadales bacterium]